jgi:hypothetical protein
MSVELFWNTNREVLKKHFPHKSRDIDAIQLVHVSAEYLREAPTGVLLCYEVVKHAVLYTSDFLNQLEAGKEGNPKLTLDLIHQSLHELMHAISYRKIVLVDDKNEEICSGIQIGTKINGIEKMENVLLNEIMTNHFVRMVMKEDPFVSLPGAALYLYNSKGDSQITGRLVELAGEDVVKCAYFEGKFRQLERRIAQKGINSTLLFTLLDSLDPLKQHRGLKMLGLSRPC